MTEGTKICRYCGASYDAGELKCPYCGNTNVAAAESAYLDDLEDMRRDLDMLADGELDDPSPGYVSPEDYAGKSERDFRKAHAGNMETFDESFNEAKADVLKTVSSHRRFEKKTLIAVALFIAFVILCFIRANIENIYYDRARDNAAKNEAEYTAEIERLIREEDYLTLRHFFQYRYISPGGGHYDAYMSIYRQNIYYHMVVKELRETVYRNMDYDLPDMKYLAGDIRRFFEYSVPEDYEKLYIDEAKTQEAYEGMLRDIHALLKHYAGFSDNDLEALPEMGESALAELLTERFNDITGD